MGKVNYVIFLCLIAMSCDNYQYNLTNDDGAVQTTVNSEPPPPETDSMTEKSVKFSLLSPIYQPDFYGSTITCNIDITSKGIGGFIYPNNCDLRSRTPADCFSVFSLLLLNQDLHNIPDTSSGDWKIRILGSYKTRNYFNLQAPDVYAYLIDSVEIYAVYQGNRRFLGNIQGDDWTQVSPTTSRQLSFEIPISAGSKLDFLQIRLSRRCKKDDHFDINRLDTGPPAVTSTDLSEFIINHVEFVQTKQ